MGEHDGTSFTRSESIADCPSIDMVADFQGAWKEVREEHRPPLQRWLRTFFIMGRAWFGGDGSSGYLQLREADGAIVFQRGVLERTDSHDMISRTGQSGIRVRFERFVL